MPQLLRGPDAEKDAEDIAGFLATLTPRKTSLERADDRRRIQGTGHTFASLAASVPRSAGRAESPEPGRLMLAYVPQVEAGGAADF